MFTKGRTNQQRTRGLILGLLFLAMGCNDVPVYDVTRNFAVQVREVVQNTGVIKLDFLWIIDNSSSMCQEQAALAASFRDFRGQLEAYLNIDVRLAVTTTDAVGNQGKFVNSPAENFPPGCYEKRFSPCLDDSDCEDKFGGGWQCKEFDADEMYNLNGSVNSSCTFRCVGDGDCCGEFCFLDECGGDMSCVDEQCSVATSEVCPFECRQPGSESSGCLRPPDTGDCPPGLQTILTMQTLDQFKCLATVKTEQTSSVNLEQGLKAAWDALDSGGPNPEQVEQFLRPDAYLVIVFVSDEDDCSIHEDFCAPNDKCESNDDCREGSVCRLDYGASMVAGKPEKRCCGMVKGDYFNNCALLGDFKGDAHHLCAYNMACSDCEIDEDCDEGWYCREYSSTIHKCRPMIYSLGTIATYQTPPGSPIHSLRPVADYYSRFRSLKADPAKVLIAVISGDGLVRAGDKESLISDACIADTDLNHCQDYLTKKGTASAECVASPSEAGCEELYKAKLECVRQCYVASKGNPDKPSIAQGSYVCASEFGIADWGSRYIRLAQMFGPNGLVSNICSEDGIAPALRTIAELIIRRVTKICLPRPVKEGQQVVVKRVTPQEDAPDLVEVLAEGDDADYTIEFPVQECCLPDALGNCTGTLKALTFNDVLDPKATIEIKYESTLDGDTGE